jgi:hypothetical protein
MIISHAYKYVFLTTRKTASTSTALCLLQNLFEEGDISIRDYRPKFEHPEPIIPVQEGLSPGVRPHWDMRYIVEDTNIDLKEYKIFSVLRNPYERIISRAFYKTKGDCRNIFEARKVLTKGYVDEDDRDWPQSAYFKYNDEVIAEVWDYSRLDKLLPAFVRSYGKEPKHPLQRLKSEHRPTWATIESVITPAIKEKIDQVFAEDIELYNKYLL